MHRIVVVHILVCFRRKVRVSIFLVFLEVVAVRVSGNGEVETPRDFFRLIRFPSFPLLFSKTGGLTLASCAVFSCSLSIYIQVFFSH